MSLCAREVEDTAETLRSVVAERDRMREQRDALLAGIHDLHEQFHREALALAFNTHGALDAVQRCNLRTYRAVADALGALLPEGASAEESDTLARIRAEGPEPGPTREEMRAQRDEALALTVSG